MSEVVILEIAAGALTIVMTCMAILWALCFAMQQIARRASVRTAAGTLPVADLDDPALVAVLAAAAAEALGRQAVVHHVSVPPRDDLERWSRAGRLDIMISRRVEPRR